MIIFRACIISLMVLLASTSSPNIIYILVDDVGWADFNYNVNGKSLIPTPNIDRLAAQGIKLKSHYVQPTCTPSRAALMTGRYATNTGLTFAMFPSSYLGLPDDMLTMPQLLRKAGYNAHMVGKWHLGDSKWKQTPVGKGFETHTGNFLWDLDSYDKSMWKHPGEIIGIDWIEAYETGTYRHKIDKKHATHLITEESIKKMESHNKENPLFLYVSYTAAHSPLQPDLESASKCQHIPHLWRRQFCGMVVGLDTAIGQIYETAQEKLGSNTVIVVSSDNGGSVWLGGLNQPLRSGKLNVFEGGVRVPAFAVDLSGEYLGKGGREFQHKMHISDWLPTFLSWADAKDLGSNLDLDGIDHSEALISGEEARKEVLLDVYSPEDSHDNKSMFAYIKGNYKLIKGDIRDPYYYMEPNKDFVNSTDPLWYPRGLYEPVIRFLDYLFGERKAEMFRVLMSNVMLFDHYAARIGPQTYLFDLEKDIKEEHNIADQHPQIVQDILATAEKMKEKSPPQGKYFMVDLEAAKIKVKGDCSESTVPDHLCKFVHPWVSDDADVSKFKMVNGADVIISDMRVMSIKIAIVLGVFVSVLCYFVCGRRSSKGKQKLP